MENYPTSMFPDANAAKVVVLVESVAEDVVADAEVETTPRLLRRLPQVVRRRHWHRRPLPVVRLPRGRPVRVRGGVMEWLVLGERLPLRPFFVKGASQMSKRNKKVSPAGREAGRLAASLLPIIMALILGAAACMAALLAEVTGKAIVSAIGTAPETVNYASSLVLVVAAGLALEAAGNLMVGLTTLSVQVRPPKRGRKRIQVSTIASPIRQSWKGLPGILQTLADSRFWEAARFPSLCQASTPRVRWPSRPGGWRWA